MEEELPNIFNSSNIINKKLSPLVMLLKIKLPSMLPLITVLLFQKIELMDFE